MDLKTFCRELWFRGIVIKNETDYQFYLQKWQVENAEYFSFEDFLQLYEEVVEIEKGLESAFYKKQTKEWL